MVTVMISIIVPVYNCEKYLKRCVDSVLAQTEQNLQLILVDDGSTDGSGALCDVLAAQDDRIIAIHQKNAGVSAARNAGLDVATGDYIGFVDADDYIAKDTYETALAAVGDCDMVMWDAVTVWDGGRTEEDTIPLLKTSCTIEKENWTPELLLFMAGAVWRCLYRAELIADVRFPVGIKLSEDRLFNLYVMGKAGALSYLKRGMYFRCVRAGSAVNRYHGDRFEKSLLAVDIASAAIEQYWDKNYIPVYTRIFVIGGALSAVYEICSGSFSGKSRRKAIREITEHEALSAAFQLCPPRSIQEKLLCRKANTALYFAGIAYNWKNR